MSGPDLQADAVVDPEQVRTALGQGERHFREIAVRERRRPQVHLVRAEMVQGHVERAQGERLSGRDGGRVGRRRDRGTAGGRLPGARDVAIDPGRDRDLDVLVADRGHVDPDASNVLIDMTAVGQLEPNEGKREATKVHVLVEREEDDRSDSVRIDLRAPQCSVDDRFAAASRIGPLPACVGIRTPFRACRSRRAGRTPR